MWGAIIGDLAGSLYEYEQSKKISKVTIENLIEKDSFYSDDTILTVAVIDAILNNYSYEEYLKRYGNKYMNYKSEITPYFDKIFSPGFIKWLKGNNKGDSIGNGAMMRISGVGYLFDDEKNISEESKKATMPSHNNDTSISCATTIAMIIYYARIGLNKDEIISKLNINLKYISFKKFNMTCDETINNCLYALFTTNNFEDSIKKVISFGGDTDTNAAIVGSMAEALYGIDEYWISLAKTKIPKEFNKVISKAYKKVKIYK